jgi:hypothetical protein
MLNTKSIRGVSNMQVDIKNTDVNATWLTVTADTVTATNKLYINTLDVEVELNNKQDVIDSGSDFIANDITCNDLIVNDLIVNGTSKQLESVSIGSLSTPNGALHISDIVLSLPTREGIIFSKSPLNDDYNIFFLYRFNQCGCRKDIIF